jgi:hypothetical protein
MKTSGEGDYLMRLFFVPAACLMLSACVGQTLGRPDPLTPSGSIPSHVSQMVPSDGYVQITVTGNYDKAVSQLGCDNILSRYGSFSSESTVFVSMNSPTFAANGAPTGPIGAPIMSVGFDNAKNSCNLGQDQVVRFIRRWVPGQANPIDIYLQTLNGKAGTISPRRIVEDFVQVAGGIGATIVAGPTSGIVVAAGGAAVIAPLLPESITRNLNTENRRFVSLNINNLRNQAQYKVEVLADSSGTPRIGEIVISADYQASIFSDASSPLGAANFAGKQADDLLRMQLPISGSPNGFMTVEDHVRNNIPRLDELRGELRNGSDNPGALRSLCDALRNYANAAGLTRRDSIILRWAYNAPTPHYTSERMRQCFTTDDLVTLTQMGIVAPPAEGMRLSQR